MIETVQSLASIDTAVAAGMAGAAVTAAVAASSDAALTMLRKPVSKLASSMFPVRSYEAKPTITALEKRILKVVEAETNECEAQGGACVLENERKVWTNSFQEGNVYARAMRGFNKVPRHQMPAVNWSVLPVGSMMCFQHRN
jgi:hypothetical protein